MKFFFSWNENNPTGSRGKVPIKLLTLLLSKVTFFFFFFFSATESLEVVVVEEEAVATFTTASVFSAFAAFTPPVFVGKALVVEAFCEDEVEFETSETTSNIVETTTHEKMINGRHLGSI